MLTLLGIMAAVAVAGSAGWSLLRYEEREFQPLPRRTCIVHGEFWSEEGCPGCEMAEARRNG